jgi:hypothetical protein
MLKQDLAVIKALSAGESSPAFVKQLMATLGKKRLTATGKRKVTDLASTSECSEPATRRLATGVGPKSLQLQHQNASSDQATSGSQSPKGKLTFAGVASIDSIVGYTGSFDNILIREHLYRIIV